MGEVVFDAAQADERLINYYYSTCPPPHSPTSGKETRLRHHWKKLAYPWAPGRQKVSQLSKRSGEWRTRAYTSPTETMVTLKINRVSTSTKMLKKMAIHGAQLSDLPSGQPFSGTHAQASKSERERKEMDSCIEQLGINFVLFWFGHVCQRKRNQELPEV